MFKLLLLFFVIQVALKAIARSIKKSVRHSYLVDQGFKKANR
jgi:hypothetical protein